MNKICSDLGRNASQHQTGCILPCIIKLLHAVCLSVCLYVRMKQIICQWTNIRENISFFFKYVERI